MEQPTESVSPTLLCEFLAGRDITCPNCQGCLRDVTSEFCPKCGKALALRAVVAPEPWVPFTLLVVALGYRVFNTLVWLPQNILSAGTFHPEVASTWPFWRWMFLRVAVIALAVTAIALGKHIRRSPSVVQWMMALLALREAIDSAVPMWFN